MAMNGEAGQAPLKFGIAAVDLFTGMYSAQAVLAALLPARSSTGQGRHVEMSLYDCGLMITAYYGLDGAAGRRRPAEVRQSHPSIIPYGVFEAADGPLVITVGNNAQFQRFCQEVIERPDLPLDPRFAHQHRPRQAPDGAAADPARRDRQHPRAMLIERLTAAGIPCGEVLGLYEALRSSRTQELGLWHAYEDAEAGPQGVHAPPYVLDGQRAPVTQPPPHLGEHTDDVLADLLELSAQELAGLRARQVIR